MCWNLIPKPPDILVRGIRRELSPNSGMPIGRSSSSLTTPANCDTISRQRSKQYLGNVPNVFVVSKLTGIPDHWNRHQLDEGLAGVIVEQHLQLPIHQLVKRGTDLVVAVLASLVLLPMFALLGLAIKLTSAGPIFYGHERVGRGNSRFKAWKFRTMVVNADATLQDYLAGHPELREEWMRDHKLKNDPRVTPLGKWMRKWSIDELPQILNVLAGEMSVVGPRPIVDAEIIKYGKHFRNRQNSVLPGITGLWQVCGRNDTTYDERVQARPVLCPSLVALDGPLFARSHGQDGSPLPRAAY